VNHEKDLSAEQNQQTKNPRVSRQNGDSRWSQCSKEKAGKGQEASDRRHYSQGQEAIVSSGSSFGPERRIRKRPDFLRVQKLGRKNRSDHFLIVSCEMVADEPSGAPSLSRLGITVTKKVDKRAVVRNRLKRLIREFFRRHCPVFNPPLDLVVIAHNNASGLGAQEVNAELGDLFAQIEDRYRSKLGGHRA